MFQSIESARSGGLRWRALAASLAAHALVVVVGVVLPLVFLQVLPAGDLLTFLMAPPPPPQSPPPPPPDRETGPRRQVIVSDEFTPPLRIPPGIPAPPEDPSPPVGVVSSVPQSASGISGGEFGPGDRLLLGDPIVPTLPPPPPPVPRREPVKQGGRVQEARLIHRVDPAYPELAKRARVSGTVVLEVVVNEEGVITEIKALSGHPLLNDAAIQAVSQWRYAPLLLNGEPVPVLATVTVVFSLR